MIPRKLLRRLLNDESGVGSVLMIVLLPMFIGLAALAIDGAAAYRMQTILQATADASAHAAAIDLPDTTKAAATAVTYATKNLPVASNGNVLVSSDIVTGIWDKTARTFTAGRTPANAIRVTVRRATANGNALPTAFLGMIGRTSWDVSATATAAQGTISAPICMLTKGTFTAKGAPSVDFSGCLVMSDGSVSCNSNPPQLGATSQTATVGTTDPSCSTKPNTFSNVPAVADPYVIKYPSTNVPSGNCDEGDSSKYVAEHKLGNKQSPDWVQWSGTKTYSSRIVCGDLQLTGNTVIQTPSGQAGTVLEIRNGALDLNGFKLSTASGSALTIIFSGTNTGTGSSNLHYPTDNSGGGILDFNAPTSGTWSGVAMYQDPTLSGVVIKPADGTTNLDITYTGNSPAWKISGLVYMPNANLTFKGDVGQASNGEDCFVTVANTVVVNGKGSIYAQTPNGSGCQRAGLQQPTATLPTGWKLVM